MYIDLYIFLIFFKGASFNFSFDFLSDYLYTSLWHRRDHPRAEQKSGPLPVPNPDLEESLCRNPDEVRLPNLGSENEFQS